MHHCHDHHNDRARIAHAHVAHSMLAILGGLVLFHIVKLAHRGLR
jgi:hypothetical protein